MRRALLLLLAACPAQEPPPYREAPREACADHDPLRKLYFGDLHVHTSLSFDAWVFDVRTTPADAYRFAKGEPVGLPPLDAEGRPTRTVRLARPLDFVALTDHSEYLGEVRICTDTAREGSDSHTCAGYRTGENSVVIELGARLTQEEPARFRDICGEDRSRCVMVGQEVWRQVQAESEAAYDRSAACRFTAFTGYEYSAVTNTSNLHRVVVFKNERVPPFAASYFDFPKPKLLFDTLKTTCLDAGNGCDVITIPHNGNWSNGNLFRAEYPGARSREEELAQASLRARLEPLYEVFQHKGDGECSNGLSGVLGRPDELCDFEKLRKVPPDCGDGTGAGGVANIGCVSRRDFLRGILLAGMQEEQRIGLNPFKVGVVASTDTHNGTPGEVRERGYPGHWGNNEESAALRLGRGQITPGGVLFNGGGLTAVWAEENSRASIFEALRRREAYGTSGPRIAVRMFGGFGIDADRCADPEQVRKGYAGGVPMGGTLGPGAGSPRFFVSALADPGIAGEPGVPLAGIQIVKGWLDAEGRAHVEVFDVAGDPRSGRIDLDTCRGSGDGAPSLCTVWTDPAFDPAAPSFWYARVLEQPSCRWSWWECLSIPESERPPSCSDPNVDKLIQERAWTSPIWYAP